MSRLAAAAVTLALLVGSAWAEDPYDRLRRPDGTLPLVYDNLDRMHADMAGTEVMMSRGRSGARTRGLHMAMPLSRDHADHDDLVSVGMEMIAGELIDLGEDDLRDDMIWQGLGVQLRYDQRHWGVAAGGHLLSSFEDEETSVITPWLGAKVGDSAGLILALDARAPGLHLVSSRDAGRTLGENYDVDVRVDGRLSKHWHGQARLRHRNLTTPDVVLTETIGVIGLEAAFEINLRFVPVFFGIGVRSPGEHQESSWDPERRMHRLADVDDEGTQLVVMVDLSIGMHGDNTRW